MYACMHAYVRTYIHPHYMHTCIHITLICLFLKAQGIAWSRHTICWVAEKRKKKQGMRYTMSIIVDKNKVTIFTCMQLHVVWSKLHQIYCGGALLSTKGKPHSKFKENLCDHSWDASNQTLKKILFFLFFSLTKIAVTHKLIFQFGWDLDHLMEGGGSKGK